jgi:hypothetical protein
MDLYVKSLSIVYLRQGVLTNFSEKWAAMLEPLLDRLDYVRYPSRHQANAPD